MFINLSESFLSQGFVLTQQVTPDMKTVHLNGQDYRIAESQPITVTASCLEKGKALLQVNGILNAELFCDRCLAPVKREIRIDFEQEVYAPDAVPPGWNADEQVFMEGSQLDITALINSEIVMNWPPKILCREDCKGICTICGKNLNEGECGCDPFVPDVRMAAIKELFLANKEV